jgi:hypothetical protein
MIFGTTLDGLATRNTVGSFRLSEPLQLQYAVPLCLDAKRWRRVHNSSLYIPATLVHRPSLV